MLSSWEYEGSFYINGEFDGEIAVAFVSNTTSKIYAQAAVDVSSSSNEWTQYHYSFQPSDDAPDSNNTLQFTMPASGVKGPLNFNLLSLFPPTYNERPNGLRIDLMEAMAGLNPSFFRFPGGNNLEGNEPPFWCVMQSIIITRLLTRHNSNRWDWKKTLGPLKDRPGYPGTWQYENTNGLGLLEYLLWSEDLGMERILGVWAGLWLNGSHIPESELGPYVQDALDELEFCMGDSSTKWGAYRAALGHPETFPIRFVEVGNEDSLSNGTKTYKHYRFEAFYKAIKAIYPDITIIASFYDVGRVTPPFDASGDFHEYAVSYRRPIHPQVREIC